MKGIGIVFGVAIFLWTGASFAALGRGNDARVASIEGHKGVIQVPFGSFGVGFAAYLRQMLEGIAWDQAVSHAEVISRIQTAGMTEGEYLSIGESHIYSPMNHLLFEAYSREYIQSAESPVRVCAENNLLKEDSLTGYLRSAADQIRIFTGNTPNTTNFRGCNRPDGKDLVLSGFFHQYPLPQIFPRDFSRTPVATKPGNTIYTQLTSQRGVFISAIDLVYIENQTTRAVLIENSGDPKRFRERVAELERHVQVLRSKMEEIVAPTDKTRSFRGAYFSRSAILSPAAASYMPEDAYILITDPEFRSNWEPFALLRRLAELDDAALTRAFQQIKASLMHATYTKLFDFLDPETGNPLPYMMGTLPDPMAPGTEFLILWRPEGGNPEVPYGRYFTAAPETGELVCYEQDIRGAYAVRTECAKLF